MGARVVDEALINRDRKSTRLNSSHVEISYAVFCLNKNNGALGGLNGALLAGYFRGANVDIGNEYMVASIAVVVIGVFFFFNDTATTEIYTLSLHDALPI